MGRPLSTEACWRDASLKGTGIIEVPERASESDLVRDRSRALKGAWGGGTIVGCVCGGAVSTTWRDALYWKAGWEIGKSSVVVDKFSSVKSLG